VRRAPPALALLLALLAIAGHARAETPDAPRQPLLLGDAFPIETSNTFHAALLHWLDSIAALDGPGMTAGKTVGAHRRDYEDRLGRFDGEAVGILRGYADLRIRFARRHRDSADALAAAFFEAPTLDTALERAGALIDETSLAELRAALDYFTPGYRTIWRQGRGPRRFLAGVREAPERAGLTDFLLEVARFYGVDADDLPRPRMILAPVRSGHGTHAQTLGRNLLLEVRDGESLSDQVGPIVHENAHFLYRGMDRERLAALRRHASQLSPEGTEAFRVLEEALPTSIAQGLAEERFRQGWKPTSAWYHVAAVDRYAKRIFPLVKLAIEERRSFDEALLGELIEAYRPEPRPAPVIPRSP